MKKGLPTRLWLLAAIVTLGLHQDVNAQCVVFKVTVDGQVQSGSKNTQVLVRVHANRGKKSSEARAAPEGGHFHVEVGFDTFVSVHFFGAHNCSRHPTGVDVILLAGGIPEQTVRLSLDRDFTFNEKGAEWRTKVPVVLGKENATPSKVSLIVNGYLQKSLTDQEPLSAP